MEKKTYIKPHIKMIYFAPHILDLSIDTGGNHESGDPSEDGAAKGAFSIWSDDYEPYNPW